MDESSETRELFGTIPRIQVNGEDAKEDDGGAAETNLVATRILAATKK